MQAAPRSLVDLLGETFARFLTESRDAWLIGDQRGDLLHSSVEVKRLLAAFNTSSSQVLEHARSGGAVVVARDESKQLSAKSTAVKVEGGEAMIVRLEVSPLQNVDRSRHRQEVSLKLFQSISGTIAHDFNNLLMAVLSFAELLKLGLPEDQNQTFIQEIEKSTRRATQLLHDLRSASQPPMLAPRDLELSAWLQEEAPRLCDHADVTLEVVPNDARVIIHYDARLLRVLLKELFDNAHEAMPDGGVITLTTRCDEASKMMLIQVQDQGSGVINEHFDAIFDPFFTTHPKARGGGLGLTRALHIAKAHGGSLSVTANSPPPGTTFTITLPLT